MGSAATLDLVEPEAAAEMLRDDGVALLTASTDEGLARALAAALIARGIRLGAAPNDYPAVRHAHRLLIDADELRGRRLECERYRPAFIPRKH